MDMLDKMGWWQWLMLLAYSLLVAWVEQGWWEEQLD
jgi:hypothetical protein